MAELPLLIPDWPAPANVRAAMTTRVGGVSVGPYASLNLGAGVDDDPAQVAENRRRLAVSLDLPSEPVWLKQVHGTTVMCLRDSPPPCGEGLGAGVPAGASPSPNPLPQGEGALIADASFTTDPGAVCVVMAADCLPVLFCDDAGTVVAAAHAGWRGLAAGVIESTVRALPVKPQTLLAWLGAAIGPESFEVGAEVREAFVSRDARAADCFTPLPSGGEAARSAGEGEPKYLADLYGLARQRLESAGVTRVYGGGRCTVREPRHFFSHRRDGRCGRMAALVWLS